MELVSHDSFAKIGADHHLCEDYAISSPGVIVVSDGCSSSDNTDFGSQVLSRLVMDNLRSCVGYPEHINQALESAVFQAGAVVKGINLDLSCLDATIVSAMVSDDHVHIAVAGDGAVAWKYAGVEPMMLSIEYESNAPYYLSYLNDKSRQTQFLNEYPPVIDVKCNRPGQCPSFGHFIGDLHHDIIKSRILPLEGMEWIAVFSDGVFSFQNVDTFEVVKNLTSFKNFKGQFVKRRAKRYLKQPENIHYDDVSMAAMCFKESVDENCE